MHIRRCYERALQMNRDAHHFWHDLALAYFYLAKVFFCVFIFCSFVEDKIRILLYCAYTCPVFVLDLQCLDVRDPKKEQALQTAIKVRKSICYSFLTFYLHINCNAGCGKSYRLEAN